MDVAAVAVLLAETAATRPYRELTQVVHHYLARLDPDGPEPDPTVGRRLTLARHADGSVTGRFDLDAVGWGEGAGGAGVDAAGPPARRRPAQPRPAAG